jgi:Tol biopolymer transport system component/DNA-binding winged helix-turn-helix (wHTH) protein
LFGNILENRSKTLHDQSERRLSFDHFEIDVTNRMLWRSGLEVPLTGKVFDILLVLAQNPGRLLTKSELLERVWDGEFVEEGNLARNVSTLRKALGDTGKEHKYIVTVQGQGYRFIGDVISVDTAALPLRLIVPNSSLPGHRSWRNWYWAAGVLLLGGLVTLGIIYRRAIPNVVFNPRVIAQTRFTTEGKATKSAISPDGEQVAYIENGVLKLKSLSGSNERVFPETSPKISYVGLAFSPDGTYLYFSAKPWDVSTVTLYRIPVAGGEPQRVLDDVYGNISFSPDGKKLSFVRRYPELNQNILIVADADGSNTSKLAISQRPNHFDGSPSWSPDGSTIVCPAINTDLGFHFVIAAVRVSDGAVETIKTRRWAWLSSLVWLPDSRRLLIVGQDESAVNAQIWQLDRFTGDTRQLSDDSFIYESLSGSRDGERFVAIKKRLESHVWIGDEPPVQVTTGFDRYDGLAGLAWDSAGRLLYSSRASGRDAIWRMEILTPDGGSGFAVSPDSRFLVFQIMEANSLGLSRLDLKTGERKRLTENNTDMTPNFSPDGQWIVYSSFAEKHALKITPVDGGESLKLFDEYRTVSSPDISPDGKLIAFTFKRTQADELQSGIGVFTLADRRVVKTFPVDIRFGTIYEQPTVQWSADGRWLYYVKYQAGVSNVWRINVADGSNSAVTDFNSGRVFNFRYSRDGSRLAIARGTVESDVLLIRLATGTSTNQ